MPAPALTVASTVLCAHAGVATPVAPFPRVLLDGQPVVTLSSPYVIAACALTGTGAPPCATGQMLVGAARVLAGGAPVASLAGMSICVPTGQPMLALAGDPRVLVT